jgi:energy-coupling factor transporter transmembrane protein EcfT
MGILMDILMDPILGFFFLFIIFAIILFLLLLAEKPELFFPVSFLISALILILISLLANLSKSKPIKLEGEESVVEEGGIDLKKIARHRIQSLKGLVSGYGCSDFRFRPVFPSGVLPSGFKGTWECCLLGQGGWGRQPSPQQVPSQPPRYIPVEQVDKMLREGSVEEWIEILKKAVESGEKIKMLPGYESKEGYRNLLVALYIILEDVKPEKLKETIEDKFISRAIEYFKQLRKRPIEIPPESSDREYIDTILQIICGDPAKEEKTETETTKQYKLILKDREVVIERKTIKDPATKRAQKMVYSQRAPA